VIEDSNKTMQAADALSRAATAGDQAAAQKALDEGSTAGDKADQAAAQLGLDSCEIPYRS
jgi:hypothetical protein